jgi:uncharacterized damage-inducible protein DinB
VADQTVGHSHPVEPWLRGTLTHLPALHRAVIHALELAEEDILHWCDGLSAAALNARPAGVPSLSFLLRHIPGSVDRLLSYAEGKTLTAPQRNALAAEQLPVSDPRELLVSFAASLNDAKNRIRALSQLDPEIPRSVGQQALPTRLGGLLIHVADHTQRHVGQAITIARFIKVSRLA